MQPTGQHHMVSAETRRNMSRSTTRTNTPIRGSQTLHKSFPWKQSLPVSLRLQDGHEDTTNLISFLLFWRCKADNRKKKGGGGERTSAFCTFSSRGIIIRIIELGRICPAFPVFCRAIMAATKGEKRRQVFCIKRWNALGSSSYSLFVSCDAREDSADARIWGKGGGGVGGICNWRI